MSIDTFLQVIPDASDITVTESDKFVDDPDFNSPATIEVELEELLIASIYSCCKQPSQSIVDLRLSSYNRRTRIYLDTNPSKINYWVYSKLRL